MGPPIITYIFGFFLTFKIAKMIKLPAILALMDNMVTRHNVDLWNSLKGRWLKTIEKVKYEHLKPN